MALVTSMAPIEKHRSVKHQPTECGYAVIDIDGDVLIQIETYGSAGRRLKGKTSQVIQLDENGARTLVEVIRGAFPRIGR